MARLTIEKVMDTSYQDLRSSSYSEAVKALKAYTKQIKLLGATASRLEPLREMIDSRLNEQQNMETAIHSALGEVVSDESAGSRRAGFRPYVDRVFEPGCSAVVVGSSGHVYGVYDRPNDNPNLQAYGSGLMWAMLHLGREAFAVAQTRSSAHISEGYGLVSEAFFGGDIKDIPYAQRHHIGSSSREISMHPTSPDMRKAETATYHAAVSGVLLTPRGLDHFKNRDARLLEIATEAVDTNAHEGFEGNIFAGSIDSTLASFILATIDPLASHLGTFRGRAASSIIERHDQGINVH